MKYLSRWAGWAQCETRGYFHTPKVVLFFPPSHLTVFPVVNRYGWLWAGPWAHPGSPLSSPCSSCGAGSRGFPLKAPSRATRCVQGQGVLFGEERCALLQGPWAGGTCSHWFWDVIAIPMTCGVILNPQLLASWECGRIPLLFFLPPLFNFKLFPTLTEASSKI